MNLIGIDVDLNKAFASASRIFEPATRRAALHPEGSNAYCRLVSNRNATVYASWR